MVSGRPAIVFVPEVAIIDSQAWRQPFTDQPLRWALFSALTLTITGALTGPAPNTSLFVPDRDHWIDFGGSPRRNEASAHRNKNQQKVTPHKRRGPAALTWNSISL
jgi:hypothetical protein